MTQRTLIYGFGSGRSLSSLNLPCGRFTLAGTGACTEISVDKS